MTQRIKFFLTFLFGLVSTAGFAANPADGDYLYVFTNQSKDPAIYSLDDLDKITFSGTGINFWSTRWPAEYAYSNFQVITFNDSPVPSSVDNAVMSGANVAVFYDHLRDAVCVESERLLSAVVVYDLQGRPVGSARYSACSYVIPLSGMPRGIYIVKTHGAETFSQKIIK